MVVDTRDSAHRLVNPMVVRPQTAGATRMTPSTAGTDCPVIVTMAMAPPMLSPRRKIGASGWRDRTSRNAVAASRA